MKTDTRTYTMGARADAVDATRERIARAALARFIADSYDAVTIASVAKDAGVSHQTVLNHFASKEGLFTAAAERFGADVVKLRGERTGQDAASAVALAIEQYEATGDGNVRLAMLDDRIPAVKAALDVGRATHQAWLAEVFADELPIGAAERAHVLSQLHAATDVYTWKLLRRDFGLGRRATQKVMTDTVTAILDSKGMTP
jgi:AcrR family transcriptional regulator